MRLVCPLVAAALIVVACGDDDTTPATGSSSSSGSGTSSSSGDDCLNLTALDCDAQYAHAKTGNCGAVRETNFREACKTQNCAGPKACESQLKALGDCTLANKVTCRDDGSIEDPLECKPEEGALIDCQLKAATGG